MNRPLTAAPARPRKRPPAPAPAPIPVVGRACDYESLLDYLEQSTGIPFDELVDYLSILISTGEVLLAVDPDQPSGLSATLTPRFRRVAAGREV